MIERTSNYFVEIDGEILAETGDAYYLYDGKVKIWLPKSQCAWNQDEKTMQMPGWLALDEGLI